MNAQRIRLDQLVAERRLLDSRARARDAILRGRVRVEGVVVSKPGQTVDENAQVELDDPAAAYVSRAALKLLAGLDAFDIRPDRLDALDVGASTGGFTQVLLERGAAHVIAVDVGHGQLHTTLREDARVTCLEALNARDLSAEHLGGRRIGLVVSDVSFISLRLALPPALALAESGAKAVLLVKPQFEAGREAIGKGGLLRDPTTAPTVAAELAEWLNEQPGWRSLGIVPSPIAGGDGNAEFLLGGVKA
jgi:23S rRNA (cytidine1920-2'-O)/16S rRNA (cytidine1409-2'-O)-methyltransferase